MKKSGLNPSVRLVTLMLVCSVKCQWNVNDIKIVFNQPIKNTNASTGIVPYACGDFRIYCHSTFFSMYFSSGGPFRFCLTRFTCAVPPHASELLKRRQTHLWPLWSSTRAIGVNSFAQGHHRKGIGGGTSIAWLLSNPGLMLLVLWTSGTWASGPGQ